MLALDPKTLSLVVGLGNLVFALLATLYIARTRTGNPALETWRWGRLLAGCGFLANLASSAEPGLVPAVLGNILQTLGGTFDIAAYCLLLERRNWRRPLALLAGTTITALLLVAAFSEGQHLRLLVFSLAGVVFYGVMSVLLLRASRDDWLLRLIGLIDLLMASVLLLRVARGLAFSPVVRFDSDLVTLLLYLTLYLVVTVSGFGFLLLVKQKDDRELQRALEELAQADENRRHFLSTASHEFRTPAALIKTSLDSLRFVSDPIPPEVARRLDNIRLASTRLIELANTLLTHDRLSQQAMHFEPAPVELCALIHDALRPYPPESAIETVLPETPVTVPADAAQLRIAVQNLIDNALEHNPPGSGAVVVSLEAGANAVEIRVADHGSGIPDSEKPDIFRRFHNLRGELTRGIGLSIVHNVARNHGGEALVRDNHPRGTIMVLRLPKAA